MSAIGYTGGDPSKVDIAGDTMTGPLILSGDPVVALGAATKQFAESQGGGGGGGTPSNTVVTETSYGQPSTAGVVAEYSRGDHTHGTPAVVSVPSASGTVVNETTYSQAATAGAVGTFSRGDHTHGTPALPTPAAIGASPTGHTHVESDVTSLVADLAGKQPLDSDLTTIAGLAATTDNVIQSVASTWASRTPAQLKTTLALVKGDVGLGNVDNTSDLGKPISTATQTALDTKQPLDSDLTDIAALTSANDSVIQRKAGAWTGRTMVQLKTDLVITESDVSNLVTDLANKQPLDSDLTAIAGLTATTDNFIVSVANAWASRTPTQVKATLAIAESDVTNLVSDLALKAPLASPTFTGTPAAPTASQGTNTTQLATTAYVQTEAGLLVPKSLIDAKGDLFVGSANDAVARLAVGSDGQVLTADAASTNGVKWAAAGGGATDLKIGAYPKTGLWYRAPQIGPPNSSTNLTMTLNVLYLVPFRCGLGFTIDRIGFELVTVGGAGAVVRYGIFNAETTNYLPGTLVFDSGTAAFTITSGTGSKVATISQALSTGLVYWFGLVTQVTAGAVVRATVSNDPLIPYFTGAAAITGTEGAGSVFATGISGALASNPTISGNDRGPILSVRCT